MSGFWDDVVTSRTNAAQTPPHRIDHQAHPVNHQTHRIDHQAHAQHALAHRIPAHDQHTLAHRIDHQTHNATPTHTRAAQYTQNGMVSTNPHRYLNQRTRAPAAPLFPSTTDADSTNPTCMYIPGEGNVAGSIQCHADFGKSAQEFKDRRS